MVKAGEKEDRTWYVVIERMVGTNIYVSFMGAGGESYRGYAELVRKNGCLEVVAEQFGVSDAVVNRLTGFDKDGRRTENPLLNKLVDDLNEGRVPDVKEALAALCKER